MAVRLPSPAGWMQMGSDPSLSLDMLWGLGHQRLHLTELVPHHEVGTNITPALQLASMPPRSSQTLSHMPLTTSPFDRCGAQDQSANKWWQQELNPKLFEFQRHTTKLPQVIVLKC